MRVGNDDQMNRLSELRKISTEGLCMPAVEGYSGLVNGTVRKYMLSPINPVSYSSMIVFFGAEFTKAYADHYHGTVAAGKHAVKDIVRER